MRRRGRRRHTIPPFGRVPSFRRRFVSVHAPALKCGVFMRIASGLLNFLLTFFHFVFLLGCFRMAGDRFHLRLWHDSQWHLNSLFLPAARRERSRKTCFYPWKASPSHKVLNPRMPGKRERTGDKLPNGMDDQIPPRPRPFKMPFILAFGL